MRCYRSVPVLLLSAIIGLYAACSSEEKSLYRIASASSLMPLADELTGIFEELYPDYRLEWTFGASGILAQQILQGAEFHAFISADFLSVTMINERGMLIAEALPFAEGRLVYFVRDNAAVTCEAIWKEYNLRELLKNFDGTIVIPGPDSAPYGRAAREVLLSLESWESLQGRLVQARGVSQAVQFAVTAAESAFLSQVSMLDSRLEGHWLLVDQNLYAPVVHYAAALPQKDDSQVSWELLNGFIFSSGFQEALKQAGYRLIDQ